MIKAAASTAPTDRGSPPWSGPEAQHGPVLSDTAFACIAGLAHREAGLSIAPAKAAMVRTRLARRLRALRLTSYDEYCALVQSDAGRHELATMISALTTNVSHFFREDHHFEVLRTDVLPQLAERAQSRGRIRIWSAGCSNGQEPFSIAMTLLEAGISNQADVRILASDIDPNVIAHARAGVYPDRMTTGLPPHLRDKYFAAGQAEGARTWQARRDLRDLIAFRELNLLRDWPMRGQFDVIFCRNVVIYFDAPTRGRLWHRFAGVMPPGGWLFLGHSERVSDGGFDLFETRGITTYQRSDRCAQDRDARANP